MPLSNLRLEDPLANQVDELLTGGDKASALRLVIDETGLGKIDAIRLIDSRRKHLGL